MNNTTAADLGITEAEFAAMFGEPVSQEPFTTYNASTDEAGYIELAKMVGECRFVYVDSGGDGYCDRHGHWVTA